MSVKPAHIIETPRWVAIVRVIQFVLAIVILGCAAYGIYWLSLGAWGLAIFTSLVTMIIVLYNFLTSRVTSLHSAYNYWAVIFLDVVGAVLWLATMAAIAARRSTFRYRTTISSCYNNGYGGVCYKKRDVLVATYPYLNMMSACAVISAILLLLFIATLTIITIRIRAHRGSGGSTAVTDAEKQDGHQMNAVPQAQPQQYQAVPQQGEFHEQQTAYSGAQQQQQSYQPQPVPSPYQPQPVPAPYQPAQSPAPYQQPQSPLSYNPSVSPVPQYSTPVPQQQYAAPPPQGYAEADSYAAPPSGISEVSGVSHKQH